MNIGDLAVLKRNQTFFWRDDLSSDRDSFASDELVIVLGGATLPGWYKALHAQGILFVHESKLLV